MTIHICFPIIASKVLHIRIIFLFNAHQRSGKGNISNRVRLCHRSGGFPYRTVPHPAEHVQTCSFFALSASRGSRSTEMPSCYKYFISQIYAMNVIELKMVKKESMINIYMPFSQKYLQILYFTKFNENI